jgi:hypothetical protein
VILLIIWLTCLIVGVLAANGGIWRFLFEVEIWWIGKFGKLGNYDK